MGRPLYVILPDETWERLIKKAMKKFGHHGGIKKAVLEALDKYLRD